MSSIQLANNLKTVFFGGNWTAVNLKETIENIDWQRANNRYKDFHSIAELVYHINYFVDGVLKVLKGGSLDSHDSFSFDMPVIHSEDQWKSMVVETLENAEQCSKYISALTDKKLNEVFVEDKYGSYFQNITGIIEHTHYHLGQISLLKKMISKDENK